MLDGINLILVKEDIEGSMNQISKDEMSTHAHGSISHQARILRKRLKELQKFKIVPEDHLHYYKESNDGKINIIIRVLRSAVNFHADPITGFLEEIQWRKNRLEGSHYNQYCVKDDKVPEYREKADVVIRCVGYRSVSMPGVSFDYKASHIPNSNGCVLTKPDSEYMELGHYVSGWAKTGAKGGLYDVFCDAEETFNNFDLQVKKDKLDLMPDPEIELKRYFERRGQGYVTSFEDWFRVDSEEKKRGAKQGRIRVKMNHTGEIEDFLTQ